MLVSQITQFQLISFCLPLSSHPFLSPDGRFCLSASGSLWCVHNRQFCVMFQWSLKGGTAMRATYGITQRTNMKFWTRKKTLYQLYFDVPAPRWSMGNLKILKTAEMEWRKQFWEFNCLDDDQGVCVLKERNALNIFIMLLFFSDSSHVDKG